MRYTVRKFRAYLKYSWIKYKAAKVHHASTGYSWARILREFIIYKSARQNSTKLAVNAPFTWISLVVMYLSPSIRCLALKCDRMRKKARKGRKSCARIQSSLRCFECVDKFYYVRLLYMAKDFFWGSKNEFQHYITVEIRFTNFCYFLQFRILVHST